MEKLYAVMFFYHWSEVMDEKPKSGEEYILANMYQTNNATIALSLYAETPCPASQLIEANSKEELIKKINEIKQNFKNPERIKELKKCL